MAFNARMKTRGVKLSELGVAVKPKKPSKFRNVRTEVNGIMFDSKHEAAHYQELITKQAAGLISGLEIKVKFPLHTVAADGEVKVVAYYVSDFCYVEDGAHIVADTKGRLTPMYRLKRKWLEKEYGIVIREVYAKR